MQPGAADPKWTTCLLQAASCLPYRGCLILVAVLASPCLALVALVASRHQSLQEIAASCGEGRFVDAYPVMGQWQVAAAIASIVACVPAIGAVAVLITGPQTRHLRLAGAYSIILYFNALAQFIANVTLCGVIDDRQFFIIVRVALFWAVSSSFMVALVLFLILVYNRILPLEWVMQRDLGTAHLRRLLRLAGPVACLGVLLVCVSYSQAFELRLRKLLRFVGALLAVLSYAVGLRYMWCSVRAFSIPLRQLQRSKAYRRVPEARQAVAAAALQRNAIIGSFASSVLVIFIFAVQVFSYTAPVLFITAMVGCLDTFANAFGVVVASGALQASDEGYDAAAFEAQRRRRRRRFSRLWRPHPDRPWQEAVEDLASRGVTLRALLDFYESLPNIMPHYEARVHTTADVVRSAIIPLTRERGVPCSTQMMKGRRTFPGTMVTHVWSGLFSDLVGSVVAHALNESFSGVVTELMVTDLDAVRTLLESVGKLDDTVWVCIFSVNQHRSICHQVGCSEIDAITGLPHQRCPCRFAKYLNGTAPLRDDGKSIPCEMNKFADMISFLTARDPSFKHLIIVDPAATIFTRAWCMKEAQIGYDTGTCQTVLVASTQSLALTFRKLSQSRVEEMQASRPEDIEEILQSILDKNAFNEALQELIFSAAGLFGKLLAGDTAMQMSRVGWIARWLPLVDSAKQSVQDHFFQRLRVEIRPPQKHGTEV